MPTEDRFKQAVIITLAKRAANICSNPDCRAITSGPADDPEKAVNVGEAAHIYGANPGSARYDEAMVSADRAAITNAIWLCGNCHKLVDTDEAQFPAGLLFEWQREHIRYVSEQVGKTGAAIRQRYERRHLEEFGKLSYLAERLIFEKDDFWEYRLTAEVLRFEMAPVLRRWDALKRGLYIKPRARMGIREVSEFFSDRLSEVRQIGASFEQLLNHEFDRAWGEKGVPGDDALILATCRLFVELCGSALAWEEQVRFVSVHEHYREVFALMPGVAGQFIDEAERVPVFLTETFSGEGPTSGKYMLTLVFRLPDDWSEKTTAALEEAADKIIAGIKAGEISY